MGGGDTAHFDRNTIYMDRDGKHGKGKGMALISISLF